MITTLLAVMMMLAPAGVLEDNDAVELFGVDVHGNWSTDEAADRSLYMEFNDNSFSLELILDGKVVSKSGYYVQETKKLLLVVVDSENHQTQMDMPYYVIDSDTIEVEIEGSTYMLFRESA